MSENQLSRRSLLPAPFAEQLCWLARTQVTSPGCPGPVFTTPITQRETLPAPLCSTLQICEGDPIPNVTLLLQRDISHPASPALTPTKTRDRCWTIDLLLPDLSLLDIFLGHHFFLTEGSKALVLSL